MNKRHFLKSLLVAPFAGFLPKLTPAQKWLKAHPAFQQLPTVPAVYTTTSGHSYACILNCETGRITGVDLPFASHGIVKDPEWLEDVLDIAAIESRKNEPTTPWTP